MVLLSMAYLITTFMSNYEEVAIDLSLETISIILINVVLGVVSYIILSYGWVIQVSEKYSKISLKKSFLYIGISQIGKYLPGNFGHFLGRGLMAKEHMPTKDIFTSFAIESITVATATLCMGMLYFMYFDIGELIDLGAATLILAILAPVSIYIYLKLRQRFSLINIAITTLAKMFFLYILISIMAGIGVYLIASLYSNIPELSFIQYTSGFSLSFLVGFLMPGVPGGIGVREFVFVALFSSFIGPQTAIEIILIVRFVAILTDSLLFAISYFFRDWLKE